MPHIEGTPSIDFGYDASGNIISENTWTYVYDLSNQLIRVLNGSNQVAEYVYLGDQLLAMIKPGESAYYFHNDHLGTPQVLTDDTGVIAWKAAYTPFGEAVPSIQAGAFLM